MLWQTFAWAFYLPRRNHYFCVSSLIRHKRYHWVALHSKNGEWNFDRTRKHEEKCPNSTLSAQHSNDFKGTEGDITKEIYFASNAVPYILTHAIRNAASFQSDRTEKIQIQTDILFARKPQKYSPTICTTHFEIEREIDQFSKSIYIWKSGSFISFP